MIRLYRLQLVALACLAVLISASTALVCAQPSSPAAPKRIAIRAGRLIDCKSDTPISNALILSAR